MVFFDHCAIILAVNFSRYLQMGADIFYIATRNIEVGEELRVWYAPHYARKLGKSPDPDGVTTSKYVNLDL